MSFYLKNYIHHAEEYLSLSINSLSLHPVISVYLYQSGFTKRYKEIEVDRQEVETNIGGYTKNRLR